MQFYFLIPFSFTFRRLAKLWNQSIFWHAGHSLSWQCCPILSSGIKENGEYAQRQHLLSSCAAGLTHLLKLCNPTYSQYCPLAPIRSAWAPCSTISPLLNT